MTAGAKKFQRYKLLVNGGKNYTSIEQFHHNELEVFAVMKRGILIGKASA
jgi:hypothetical protein